MTTTNCIDLVDDEIWFISSYVYKGFPMYTVPRMSHVCEYMYRSIISCYKIHIPIDHYDTINLAVWQDIICREFDVPPPIKSDKLFWLDGATSRYSHTKEDERLAMEVMNTVLDFTSEIFINNPC